MRKLLLLILIVGLLFCGLLIRHHDKEEVSQKSNSETAPIDSLQQNIRLDLRTDYTSTDSLQDAEPEPSTQSREEKP